MEALFRLDQCRVLLSQAQTEAAKISSSLISDSRLFFNQTIVSSLFDHLPVRPSPTYFFALSSREHRDKQMIAGLSILFVPWPPLRA